MQYIVYNREIDAIIRDAGSESGDTVTYVIYTSDGSTFASGSATYVAGERWKVTFTPTTINETYLVVLTNTTKSTTSDETYVSTGVIGSVWDAVSGAAGTSVGIANVALARLGATRILAIDEDTENARLVNAIYGTIRDEVLSAHPWNFAIKRAIPGLVWSEPGSWQTETTYVVGDYVIHDENQYRCIVAHTSGTFATDLAALYWTADETDRIFYEYSYSHRIPSDCLRILEVTDGTNTIEDFANENGLILSDYDTIYIKYIYRVTETSKYSSYFLSCFAVRLAAELAYSITGKADLGEVIMKEYEEKLRKAKALDAQESGIPEETGKDKFLTSRI